MTTQQISINCGATPNDGTGDPLRDAMITTNTNFSNLFSTPIVNTSITVGNNSVNAYVNSTALYFANNTATLMIGNSATSNVIANTSGVFTNGTVNTYTVHVVSNTLNLGTSSATVNGYSYLPNGFKMNWGWVSANSTDGNATFTSAFGTACYIVTATSNNAATTYQAAVIGSNTTVVGIRTANATSTNVYFMAIGK